MFLIAFLSFIVFLQQGLLGAISVASSLVFYVTAIEDAINQKTPGWIALAMIEVLALIPYIAFILAGKPPLVFYAALPIATYFLLKTQRDFIKSKQLILDDDFCMSYKLDEE